MDWKFDAKHGQYRIDKDEKSCIENKNNMMPSADVFLQNNENKAAKHEDDVDGGKAKFENFFEVCLCTVK
jgi:hypothetical protein